MHVFLHVLLIIVVSFVSVSREREVYIKYFFGDIKYFLWTLHYLLRMCLFSLVQSTSFKRISSETSQLLPLSPNWQGVSCYRTTLVYGQARLKKKGTKFQRGNRRREGKYQFHGRSVEVLRGQKDNSSDSLQRKFKEDH